MTSSSGLGSGGITSREGTMVFHYSIYFRNMDERVAKDTGHVLVYLNDKFLQDLAAVEVKSLEVPKLK
jgi:hypothetical protein